MVTKKEIIEEAALTIQQIMFSDYTGSNKTLVNVFILIFKQYIYASKYIKETRTFIGCTHESSGISKN